MGLLDVVEVDPVFDHVFGVEAVPQFLQVNSHLFHSSASASQNLHHLPSRYLRWMHLVLRCNLLRGLVTTQRLKRHTSFELV